MCYKLKAESWTEQPPNTTQTGSGAVYTKIHQDFHAFELILLQQNPA